MGTEGFDAEEWDAEFLDQLVQAEEQALSARFPSQRYEPPPLPPHYPQVPRAMTGDVSYSPPRQLSQRPHETVHTGATREGFVPSFPHFEQGAEFLKLQKELERVSKQLSLREEECTELRKERDKREQELKVLNSRIEVKDAEVNLINNPETSAAPRVDVEPENAELSVNKLKYSRKCNGREEETYQSIDVGPSAQIASCRYEKLSGLWNSDDRNDRRALVAKLYINCEKDFHVLYGYLNSPQNDSNITLSDEMPSGQPIETMKVSRLYSVLSKISTGDSRLEDLLEALSELCSLKNVVIIYRSLRILLKILSSSFSMENISMRRSYLEGSENSTNEKPFSEHVANIPVGTEISNYKILVANGLTGLSENRHEAPIPVNCWVSLFERICQITLESREKQLCYEAVSIMNLILMRHKAYHGRDEFAKGLVFQGLSRLLKKEAGFPVQNQAVHALYLLCNCPKVTDLLFSGVEDGEQSCPGNKDEDTCAFHLLFEVLIGLADCVSSYGSTSEEELKLRRNAVMFLAFLGSSGKHGIEMLLYHSLGKGTSLLAIILQSAVSDLDLLEPKSRLRSSLGYEVILLFREALIFLNRLVSHPQHAGSVLRALTSTTHMASMTVELASRLTQRSKLLWREDGVMTKQIRGSEIIELAQIFRKRVFAFMGDPAA